LHEKVVILKSMDMLNMESRQPLHHSLILDGNSMLVIVFLV